MATLKLESVSSTVFKVDGKSFLKGDYTVEITPSELFYLRPKNTTVGNSIVSQKAPWKTPQPYTAFIDSADTAYASADVFSLALANLVAGPTNSATNDLVNDKGTVTQATSITTGVTLSTLNGVVTTVSSTLAADTSANFTVTNTKVTTASNIQLTAVYAGNQGAVALNVVSVSNGSFVVKVLNLSSTQALNAVIKVNFLVA